MTITPAIAPLPAPAVARTLYAAPAPVRVAVPPVGGDPEIPDLVGPLGYRANGAALRAQPVRLGSLIDVTA